MLPLLTAMKNQNTYILLSADDGVARDQTENTKLAVFPILHKVSLWDWKCNQFGPFFQKIAETICCSIIDGPQSIFWAVKLW